MGMFLLIDVALLLNQYWIDSTLISFAPLNPSRSDAVAKRLGEGPYVKACCLSVIDSCFRLKRNYVRSCVSALQVCVGMIRLLYSRLVILPNACSEKIITGSCSPWSLHLLAVKNRVWRFPNCKYLDFYSLAPLDRDIATYDWMHAMLEICAESLLGKDRWREYRAELMAKGLLKKQRWLDDEAEYMAM